MIDHASIQADMKFGEKSEKFLFREPDVREIL